jgi:hypothetical protein
MSDAKPIVVVHPAVASKRTNEMLRRAGYVVVVADDPSHVAPCEVVPLAQIDVITRAALKAIKDATFDSVRAEFGEELATMLLAPPEHPDA